MDKLLAAAVAAAFLISTGVLPPAPLAQALHCPLSGSYQVQGTLRGEGGSLSLKIAGKFINSGVDGCFTSGTGSYAVSGDGVIAKGGLAVHTDWTTWWSNTTGLFLPSVAKSGGLTGQEMVIIACLASGTLTVPASYPNGGNVYAPGGGPAINFPCQKGQVYVWFVTIGPGCISCWDATSAAHFAGPAKLSLKQ